MVDMHCHILNNIDDGSKSIDQSIKMAKKAYDLGYTKIFATPHYIQDAHEVEFSVTEDKVKNLNNILKEENIDLEIIPGNEVYFVPEIVDLLKENKVHTLGNSRYVLIEFPLTGGKILNLENQVYNLVVSGYIPIIAHPERYEFSSKDINVFNELIEDGALLQINVASINGYYGSTPKKIVKKLLKNNMVSFIGTDAHSENTIYDTHEKALKKIERILKKEKLEKILVDNPKCVLENKKINCRPNL